MTDEPLTSATSLSSHMSTKVSSSGIFDSNNRPCLHSLRPASFTSSIHFRISKSSPLDYLELEDSALMAFEELGGGFDVQHVSSKTSSSTSTPVRKRRRRRVEATYLLRLEQPLPTPRDVVNALGLSFVPQLELGTTEDGAASFCRLSQSCINALDSWATKHDLHRGFTKVRIGLAHKALGDLPLLGHDPTLPHHRPHTSVSQDKRHVPEYPVHYFFYGTLASSARLERLFHLPASKIPPLQPATLFDGRIQIWAGRYRALIDEPGATVSGHAYICGSSDQEDALRTYEGDSYEVVAARLMTNGEELMGRTFRFAGFDDELTE